MSVTSTGILALSAAAMPESHWYSFSGSPDSHVRSRIFGPSRGPASGLSRRAPLDGEGAGEGSGRLGGPFLQGDPTLGPSGSRPFHPRPRWGGGIDQAPGDDLLSGDLRGGGGTLEPGGVPFGTSVVSRARVLFRRTFGGGFGPDRRLPRSHHSGRVLASVGGARRRPRGPGHGRARMKNQRRGPWKDSRVLE